MSHPHTLHRDMAPELDWYRGWGIPVKLSRTPGAIRRTPPKYGAHAREILFEKGFGEDEIESLTSDGVVLEKRRR